MAVFGMRSDEQEPFERPRAAGLTLLEVLVAMLIVALIIALVAGVVSLSRRQAGEARATSNLRQLHVATTLYVEDRGGYPLDGLEPVVTSGFLKEARILLLPEDPILEGLGTRQRVCDRPRLDPTTLRPSSFDTVFSWNPAAGFTLLDMVQDLDSNYGWIATRVLSDVRPSSLSSCSSLGEFQGRTLRVDRDGSVTGWTRIDRAPSGNSGFCRPALFTSLDPNAVCQRQ